MRDFFLTFFIEHYQLILICAMVLFLTLKIIRSWQEKKIIHQMNQLLTPIAQDVLLEKHAPALKFEAQHIGAIKKTLQGIDLNTFSKNSATQKASPKQDIQPVATKDQIKDATNVNKTVLPQHAAPSKQSQNEIVLNLKRFDTEFENLLSSMEMRAQMRKKQ